MLRVDVFFRFIGIRVLEKMAKTKNVNLSNYNEVSRANFNLYR